MDQKTQNMCWRVQYSAEELLRRIGIMSLGGKYTTPHWRPVEPPNSIEVELERVEEILNECHKQLFSMIEAKIASHSRNFFAGSV